MIQKEPTCIWIVEDDLLFKESLVDLINEEAHLELGFVAGSIEEALEGIGKHPKPHVILEDIGLPGMSGIEAIAHYKKALPDTSVIMLTIFDDDDRVFQAIQAGADGYLLKRTPSDQLLQGIEEVMQGGAPISPAIARKMMQMLARPKPDTSRENALTKRELNILEHLVEGLTIDAIGEKLFISRHTVDTHTKNIYRKLQVHNRSTLTARAIKDGLVS